jgi:RNA-directed DNA polymerase
MINTSKHLAFVLKVRRTELDNIVKNIDRYYFERTVIKFSKIGIPKKRILNPSTNRLKIIQKRILNEILSNLEIPDYAYGAVKKRDNIKNAKKHQGKKFKFTTDLKNFFPSISHSQVFEMFRSHNFSPTVSRILTQLTTYKGQLPQGTSTSPHVANLVFAKTGKILQTFSQTNHLTFTSYIDDLTFSSSKDFKDKTQIILDILKTAGYKISHKKTNYKTKNPVVTGIPVYNNRLALPSMLINKLKNTIDLTPDQIRGLHLYAKKIEDS